MNLYRVFERKSDGRFDFACQHDDRIFPVGYCAPYNEWWTTQDIVANPHEIERYQRFAHKHHGHGHATREEAAACYREYLLDNQLILRQDSISEQRKCAVCGAWTNLSASVDTDIWCLCDQHNTREEVEKLFTLPADIEIWSSW